MANTTTIKAPVEGFTGTTYVGPHTLNFKDGTAEVEDLSDGARLYLSSNGYGLDGSSPEEPAADPEPADPRKVGDEQFGTRLRDAAVDPRPEDFLAPTNAGKANPHGPDVIAPGIHALQDVRPVKAGDVHVDDIDTQDAAETQHAEESTDGTAVEAMPVPKGNASKDEWAEFARSKGASEDEVADLSRDELRDKYAPQEA